MANVRGSLGTVSYVSKRDNRLHQAEIQESEGQQMLIDKTTLKTYASTVDWLAFISRNAEVIRELPAGVAPIPLPPP